MSAVPSPSLHDLLCEDAVRLNLDSPSIEEAIRTLTGVLYGAHAPLGSATDFLRSALEREAQASTCLGEGLAIPHGELPAGDEPVAALGIADRGLPFSGPDGKAVSVVVLLGVPADRRDYHVQVLAAIARTVGQNEALRADLARATDPAAALGRLAQP